MSKCCCKNIQKNDDSENINLIQENEEENLINSEIHIQELTMNEQQNKNNNNFLKIEGISKKFGNEKVVNNFNLELFPDEIFCLLGVDGSGKTTLLKMISGLISPTEGDILLDGTSLTKNKKYNYKNVILSHQQSIFFDYLTLEENIKYINQLDQNQIIIRDIRKLFYYFNLNKKEYYGNLSDEEKMKFSFVFAMSSSKKVLIFDEPTIGIDIDTKKYIWNFIKYNQKNKIIIVSTNSFEEAEYLEAKIGIIRNGNLICSGQMNYLKEKYNSLIKYKLDLYVNPEVFNEDTKKSVFEKIKEFEPQAEIKIISDQIISIFIDNGFKIINFLEEIKSNNFIIDYNIEYIDDKNALEQIFNKINNIYNLNENNNELNN